MLPAIKEVETTYHAYVLVAHAPTVKDKKAKLKPMSFALDRLSKFWAVLLLFVVNQLLWSKIENQDYLEEAVDGFSVDKTLKCIESVIEAFLG